MNLLGVDVQTDLRVEELQKLWEEWKPQHTHLYAHGVTQPEGKPGSIVAIFIWDQARPEEVEAWAREVRQRCGNDLMVLVAACSQPLCGQILPRDVPIWTAKRASDAQ